MLIKHYVQRIMILN